MAPPMPLELNYKRQFRKIVNVWSEAYETGRGSGTGYPDLQILSDHLVPIEIKTGIVKKEILFSSPIRPSQISWHHMFAEAGGVAFFLVCCGVPRSMNAWVLPSCNREVTSRWNEGWNLNECPMWVKSGRLTKNLSLLVAGTAKS